MTPRDLVKGKSYIIKDFDAIMNKEISSVVEIVAIEEQKKNAMFSEFPGPKKNTVKYKYTSGKYAARNEILSLDANIFAGRVLKEGIPGGTPPEFNINPSNKIELIKG